MPKSVFLFVWAAVMAGAIYGFFAAGHSYPSLGIAFVGGAVVGWLNRPGNRERAPRVAGAIVFLLGLALSHRFAAFPGTGLHRLAYDAQYLAVFWGALLLMQAIRR